MLDGGVQNAFRAVDGGDNDIWNRGERKVIGGRRWGSPLGSSAWTWNGEAV